MTIPPTSEIAITQPSGPVTKLCAVPTGGLRATVTLPRGEPASAPDPHSYPRERAHA